MKYLLIIFLFFSCTKIDQVAPKVENAKAFTEILVKFKNDNPDPAFLKSNNAKVKKKLRTKMMERFDQPGFHVISVPNENVLEAFKKSDKVEWVEPNLIVEHQGSNDPLFTNLWGINNINAVAAWESGNKGNQQILVGVIDEGIMRHHEDLCGQIWVNPFDPVDGVDNDNNGYIDDENGFDFKNNDNSVFDNSDNHGTHVSGTIGAIGDNNKGVIGVSPSVKIISAKFLEGSGYISDAVEAIDYITDLKLRHKLNIVATNNSWGGGLSTAVYDAIDRARQADILFIAAAGNSAGNNNDLNPFYPASHDLPNIISVAAIDINNQLASFSCFGKTTVDIAAPGVNILSTVAANPGIGTYSAYNGTSMATPHVTGAAVLYKALHPNANYIEIKNAILNAARPVPALTDKTVTGGVLDVSSFVGNVSPPFVNGTCTVPELDLIPPTAPTNLRSLGIASPTDYKVKWDLSFDSSGIKMYYLTSMDSTGKPVLNYVLNGNDNITMGEAQIWSLVYGKTYQFSIRAIDNWGNFSSASNVIVINTNPAFNNQPEPQWYTYALRYDSLNNNGGVCNTGFVGTYYSQSATLQKDVYLGNSKSLLNPAKKGYYSEGKKMYYIPRQVDREIGVISWVDTCWVGSPINPPPNDTIVNPPPPDTRSISLSGSANGRQHTLRWTVNGGTPNSIQVRNNNGVIATLAGTVTNFTTMSLKKGGSVTYSVTARYSDKDIVSNSISLKVR